MDRHTKEKNKNKAIKSGDGIFLRCCDRFFRIFCMNQSTRQIPESQYEKIGFVHNDRFDSQNHC